MLACERGVGWTKVLLSSEQSAGVQGAGAQGAGVQGAECRGAGRRGAGRTVHGARCTVQGGGGLRGRRGADEGVVEHEPLVPRRQWHPLGWVALPGRREG